MCDRVGERGRERDRERERFIGECSENRRRASPMKINNYTRVACVVAYSCCRTRRAVSSARSGRAHSHWPFYVSGHRGIGRHHRPANRRDRLTRCRPGTMPYGQQRQRQTTDNGNTVASSVVLPSSVQSTLFHCIQFCQKLKSQKHLYYKVSIQFRCAFFYFHGSSSVRLAL